MASSSKILEDQKEVVEKRDWLDLGLGFGTKTVHGLNSVSSAVLSTISPLERVPQHLELKLGCRFVDDNSVIRTQSMVLAPSVDCHPCDTHRGYSHRSRSGVWFTLRSSVNCDGQKLPQLPKAYIRVKDESVTVFMVKTYLVKKLGLSNEAEIDIFCMGKKLHSQTLKYVQDAIWLPRLVESVSSTAEMIRDLEGISPNHLMSLHYERRCLLN